MSDLFSPAALPGAVGRSAFDSLQAENEPWLRQALIPTAWYEAIGGMQSVMVFGDTGSGKTALYHTLFWQSAGSEGYPTRLLVPWMPKMAPDIPPGPAGVRAQTSQIFDDCALAVAGHVAAFPERWRMTPEWARNSLIWFVQEHCQGDIGARLGLLRSRSSAEGSAALDDLVSRKVNPMLGEQAPQLKVVAELVKALAGLNLEGMWVIADGLERYLDVQNDLVEALDQFLSALGMFERPQQMAYKLFIPGQMEADLRRVSARRRRRIQAEYLRWTPAQLQDLVERRLALATGQAEFTLDDLCSAPKQLLDWLETVGGLTPRGWLDQLRPLVDHYFLQDDPQPIDTDTWFALREKRPPSLFIDQEERRVFVGNREISPSLLAGHGYDVLCYLYEHGGQIVSKAELYFCAYRQLPCMPRAAGDPDYEAPKAYEGVMDTLIYRLRQTIEPDPSHPVLLVTLRGRGLRLNVRW